MPITLEPIRDRVLIRKDTPEAMSKGGIIIPEVCKDMPITGEVLAVGPGKMNAKGFMVPIESQVGDRVLFPRYAGNNVTIKGEEFYLIPDGEIISKIESESP